jgi:hypothetical protein
MSKPYENKIKLGTRVLGTIQKKSAEVPNGKDQSIRDRK